jgi:hypothetical protein
MYDIFYEFIPKEIQDIIYHVKFNDKTYFSINDFKKLNKKYIVLLSGWTNYFSGHSINIVLERNVAVYNVYIINAGDGLQYHYNSEDISDNIFESPIIIKYESII